MELTHSPPLRVRLERCPATVRVDIEAVGDVASDSVEESHGVDLPSELAATSPLSTGNLNSSSIKSSASKSYENAKDLAMEQIDRGSLKDALATLSVFYNASEITKEQRHDLLDRLKLTERLSRVRELAKA